MSTHLEEHKWKYLTSLITVLAIFGVSISDLVKIPGTIEKVEAHDRAVTTMQTNMDNAIAAIENLTEEVKELNQTTSGMAAQINYMYNDITRLEDK